MAINLSSLNSMRDNSRVLLNADGSFSKASFFTKSSELNAAKDKITTALKEHINSDPRYFAVKHKIADLIDTLSDSKMSAKGLNVRQIKDIISYADSLSTQDQKSKAILGHATGLLKQIHGSNANNSPISYPPFLNDSPKSYQEAYKDGMHAMLHRLINTDAQALDNLNTNIKSFCDNVKLAFDTTQSLNLDAKTTDKFFCYMAQNACTPSQIEKGLSYLQTIMSHDNLSLHDKDLLIEIAFAQNGLISQEQLDTAILARENASCLRAHIGSDEFNSALDDKLTQLGFDPAKNIKQSIKDALESSCSKLSSENIRADGALLDKISDSIIDLYNTAKDTLLQKCGDNKALSYMAIQGLNQLPSPPEDGYLQAMPLAIQNLMQKDSIIAGGNSLIASYFDDTAFDNLAKNFNTVAQTSFQSMFLSEMRAEATADASTTFKVDINRDTTIVLSDGSKLINNYDKAKSQLSDFILKHDPTGTLDATLAAKAATVLSSMLTQETEKIISIGATIALSQDNNPLFFTLSKPNTPDKVHHFNLSEDGAGGFYINYALERDMAGISFIQSGKNLRLSSATERYELCLHMPATELHRLAKMDINSYKDIALPDLKPAEFKEDWHNKLNFNELNMQGVTIAGGFRLNFSA